MERGLSGREKARRGGGRKEERGAAEECKGEGIKRGPEMAKKREGCREGVTTSGR